MNFQSFRQERYDTYSDIIHHLPFLEFLAGKSDHVTEFGTRECYSTAAFISGCKGKVVSYDIKPTDSTDDLKLYELPCQWDFNIVNTLDKGLLIENTDLLFIDTLHTHQQVEQELALHGNRSRRWIAFHDTVTQGVDSVDIPGEEGINRAIREFMERSGGWEIVYHSDMSNGLTLIERKL